MPQRRSKRALRAVLGAAVVVLWLATSCQQGTTNGGDYRSSPTLEHAPGVIGEVRTVTLPDPTGQPFTFTYEIIDGLAIFEGDMVIGLASDFASLDDAEEIEITPEGTALYRRVCWRFLGINWHCENYRWPNAVVPYVFANDWDDAATPADENAVMRTTIRTAMDEIEAVTAVRFVPRSGQSDYLRIQSGSGCSAKVGRESGAQGVWLSATGCNNVWTVAHELLHAVGLKHEHTRHDRNGFVQIHWNNIVNDKKHNFETTDLAFDIGAYDYDSLMHYPWWAFCRKDASNNCVGPTISSLDPDAAFGQNSHLSAGDIAAVNRLYPGEPPTIAIVSPTPGQDFSRRSSNVHFQADVVDPEGMDVVVTWSSNVNGVLGTGASLTYNTGGLNYGAHVITARAVDPQGNTASATVSLTVVNDPPTIDVYYPLAGNFCTNETITFRATVIDLNEIGATLPDARVAWRVGTGSTFATGKTVTRSFPSTGAYQVVAKATDELGLWAEDWVNIGIEVCAGQPPVVTITQPSGDVDLVYDGYEAGPNLWYKDVTLTGTAVDPEDGNLTGSALVWTTDLTTIQPAILGTGTGVDVRLYSNDVCEGVTHTITLTATDSAGNVRSAVVRIRIWTLC
ncbi:MAG: hypothetical protein K0A98_15700 [Trueperaceae bacterium]|nr:hypothetical protein [Trueperaceae bacterium]